MSPATPTTTRDRPHEDPLLNWAGRSGWPRVGEWTVALRLHGTLPRVSGANAFVPQAACGFPDLSPEGAR